MAGLSVVLITWSHRSSASDLAENCPGEVEALAERLRAPTVPGLASCSTVPRSAADGRYCCGRGSEDGMVPDALES
jgi:hypothetical protein